MRICIYGASSDDIDSVYFTEMKKLAKELAKNGHSLVFGGGASGMMGAGAEGFKEENGKIYGIAPEFFHVPGILYAECTELIATKTMRERKQRMEEMSDIFIATPGGIGTLDELFEIMTLRQLKQHNKPIILYNINEFYSPLLTFMENLAKDGFMRSNAEENLFSVCREPKEVIHILENME